MVRKDRALIHLIEDHDEALKVWRRAGVKGLDLVHLDAHMDFDFPAAESVVDVFNSAVSVAQLKKRLEATLAFRQFEKDFSRQTHIGNYIYPAMKEGIVRDFYWVVPGDDKAFAGARPVLKEIFTGILRREGRSAKTLKRYHGWWSCSCLGRLFWVGTLAHLPVLRQRVLLDIDVDFLATPRLQESNPVLKIGQRRPWVSSEKLVSALRSHIYSPAITTIAYSVNGGWTPMRYRYLGDVLAYGLAPKEFRQRYERRVRAARYFDLFRETGEKEYYLKAAKIDSAYRAADNNDGPLYVAAGKWQSAEKEFLRIQRVDGRNPHPWLGLGEVALTRKDFKTARHYFQKARQYAAAWPRGKDERRESLLGSGRAALGLGRLGRARAFLEAFVRMAPLRPEGRYFLGCCHEKTGDWPKSAQYFKDAVRLGFGSLEALERLSRICCHLDANRDIINIIKSQLRPWRRGRPSAKKWAKRITRIEERMAACSSKAGRGEE